MKNNLNFLKTNQEIDLITFNKVLINTYLFLSLTIFFSGLTCYLSIKLNIKPIGFLPMLIIYFSLLFLLNYFKNSLIGIIILFLLTGFLGFYVGPLINLVLHINNGKNIILFSALLTSLNFFILSLYVFFSKTRFNYLHNFIFIGSFVILFVILFNIFYPIKLVYLLLCSFFIILSSAMILYETDSIINSGEKDYINATISLYLSIYNIFISILQIFRILSYDE